MRAGFDVSVLANERQASREQVRTDESDVGKEVGKDPDPGAGDDLGDEPEDEADDGESEEGGDESEDADGEVPDADAHLDGPEGEHDAGEDDGDHADRERELADRVRVDEPDVVLFGGEELLRNDLDGLDAGGDGRSALDAEEEGVRDERVQERACGFVGRGVDGRDALQLGIRGRAESLDGALACGNYACERAYSWSVRRGTTWVTDP